VAICNSLIDKLTHQAEIEDEREPETQYVELLPSKDEIIPKRESPFNYKVLTLNLSPDEYVDGLINLIKEHPELEGGISVYAAGYNGATVLQTFEESSLSSQLEVLILEPDEFANHSHKNYRRSVENINIDSKIFAIHVNELETVDILIRRFAMESPFFGVDTKLNKDIQFVFLNQSGSEKNISEFNNLNATLLVTVPRCGSGLFLPPFNHVAALNGRRYLSLSLNSARRRAIFSHTSKIKIDLSEDFPMLQPLERFNIQSIIGLNFCEVGDLHMPCRVSQFGNIPFLDIIVLARDPRDVAVSAAMSQIYHKNLATTKEIIESEIEDRIENYLPGVMATFSDALEMENSYVVRYENMLADRHGEFKKILTWLGWVPRISEEEFDAAISLTDTTALQSIKAAQGGDDNEVTWVNGKRFRKGVAGDWENHFTDRLKDKLKKMGGQTLIELGYVENNDW
jgi:hypothetical protein